ncbi:DoxX family protein [Bremerella sp. JC817]|uniref:DoxX family protein n=1 Tax=Bremerella sp. JC817 TaxID=3231756 RepID=UPI003458A75A
MNNPVVRGVLAVVGRLFIVTIFIMSALGNKIPQFSSVVEYMASEGVPAPQVMLAGAIVFLIVGGLSILLGFYARFGAILLFTFLVLATYFFHDFWTFEGEAAQMQTIQFMKNLSMMGTMLFIMAVGSGPWSLDKVLAKEDIAA